MNKIKTAFVAALALLNCNIIRGQIVMPIMPVYDNSAQMMYLNSLQRMAEYSNQLRPIIAETHDRAWQAYTAGQYQDCMNIIEKFFDRFTVYKAQGGICMNLYYVYGMACVKTGSIGTGISNLQQAAEYGSNDAYYELNRIFGDYYSKAGDAYRHGNNMLCLSLIREALSTGLQNPDIFILQGDANTKEKMFDAAKVSYKTARKLGSPLVNDRLKQLKIAKKQTKR